MASAAMFNEVAPVVPVSDLAAALERYRLLGFTTHSYGRGTGYGYARRDGVQIHLSEWDRHDPGQAATVVYLYVDDADAAYLEWLGAGVPGRFSEPRDTGYGLREFGYVDPDGTFHRVGCRSA